MAEAFTGFPPGGIDFWAGLSADNTKAYFDRNRGTTPRTSSHHCRPFSADSLAA
jgi:hypothetical protein